MSTATVIIWRNKVKSNEMAQFLAPPTLLLFSDERCIYTWKDVVPPYGDEGHLQYIWTSTVWNLFLERRESLHRETWHSYRYRYYLERSNSMPRDLAPLHGEAWNLRLERPGIYSWRGVASLPLETWHLYLQRQGIFTFRDVASLPY